MTSDGHLTQSHFFFLVETDLSVSKVWAGLNLNVGITSLFYCSVGSVLDNLSGNVALFKNFLCII
jgi:hypothetical protein